MTEEPETLNDLDRHRITETDGVAVEIGDLRELATKWIKKDIEDSARTSIAEKYIELPNGKCCKCTGEYECKFHREGIRLMEFLNIEEHELK